ncbi:MAG: nuclear transport factor 2 family protein [Candidatus Competibacteraceae bacterium]|nr:nuclear transport factor 2 family protein [Candidatus Competibacteraceae bacterium]
MQLTVLIDFYQTLTPDSVSRFPEFYSEDARFKDPFNEVVGIAAIQRIFNHMYRQVNEPRFVIVEYSVFPGGTMLVWGLHFHFKRRVNAGSEVIRGMSHLTFDSEGKVTYHRDYWDTAEELYMKWPLLGSVLRRLRRALAAA